MGTLRRQAHWLTLAAVFLVIIATSTLAAAIQSLIVVPSEIPTPWAQLPTPRTLLTIDTNGASTLRLELPPLLAGLPLKVFDLRGQFDSASHSVTLNSEDITATCTLNGPGITSCELTFSESWQFDAERAKDYVQIHTLNPSEREARERLIDQFEGQRRAHLKVRTRILF